MTTVSTATYKDLQAKLKDLRANGYDVQVKLNSKLEVLQAEFDRLTKELEQATAAATNTEVVTASQQYYDFFPYEPVLPVTEFDKTGNTKQYEFAGAPVYYIDRVDYFSWELDQWLTKHEGIACGVTFDSTAKTEVEPTLEVREATNLETHTTVETQPLEVEFCGTSNTDVSSEVSATRQQAEPLPLHVLLITCVLWLLLTATTRVRKRVGKFARATDQTCWQACCNLLWLSRCCYWFAVGFLRL